jgi:outer membrane protein OmpA-like peptidoglycan-associated protein
MKAKIIFKQGSRSAWSPYNLTIKSLILSAFILTGIQTTLQAQDQYTKPSWWFGVAGGANFNFYRGTTQELNSNLTVPAAFHHGNGAGLYVAPLVEFHRPDSRLGAMLQVGYDNRSAEYKTVRTPCNCPADLTTNLSYLTIEPSLRFAPFKSNFYLFGGPRLAFNLEKTFSYKQQVSPDFAEQISIPREKGDLSSMNKTLISMQIGAGYDIPLSSQNKRTQFVLSPFVSYQPYFGQSPRSIETWTVTTFRVGAALKLGRGHKIAAPQPAAALLVPDVKFTVNSPGNVPGERSVREIFPLRNYVFFDLGSTSIPDRYVLLTKDQVKDFKEDQLEVFKPKRLSGRSNRQMTVYYNILNILGDRMGKSPEATVRLTGASMEGKADGLAMAESIKQYLVSVFEIEPVRIMTEGRVKPRIASEQHGGTKELTLLREGDRRVSIWSDSPVIMMEFQSGPDVPLKPVEISDKLEAPLDSYITFNVAGGKEAFSTWSLEIKDEKGTVQNFGPYTNETMRIAGKTILGTRTEGDFTVTMIGQTQNGSTVKKVTPVHMVLWTPPKREEGMRFSVIYEFNESKSILVYERYLTDIVTPKIPKEGTVIIKGHTDNIGDQTHNQELSLARANDVRKILENSLAKAGRTDVKFEVYGFGEDEKQSPFENNFPEERFYNRTVVIDIIPNK